MRYFTLFLSVLLLSSCESLTLNEQNGVKAINSFYNSECKYSISNEGGKKIISLELMNCEAINLFTDLGVPTSNIAYLFYHATSAEERDHYKYIEVKIEKNKNGSSEIVNHKYSIGMLDTLEKQVVMFDVFMSYLNSGKFKEMYNYIDPTNSVYKSEDRFVGRMDTITTDMGEIRDIWVAGFKPAGVTIVDKEKSMIMVYAIIAVANEDKKQVIRMLLDPGAGTQTVIYDFGYKLPFP